MTDCSIKIAVTGGVGSGKSTVCSIFEKLGMIVYSADQFAREVAKKETSTYHKIVEHFGKQVLKKNGCINRQLLRKIITQNSHDRIVLEKIVHPEIISLMKKNLAEAQNRCQNVAMEVPLLFELGLENLFDLSVMVYSEKKLKIQRLQTRDNVTEEKASALIGLQMADEKKIKRSDFVVYNSGSQEQLAKDVKRLYKKILEREKWYHGAKRKVHLPDGEKIPE
ncbi:MAG: dephospho-CoA kinase [Desulfobacterales bacterium]